MVRPKNKRIWKHFRDPRDKSAICKYCNFKYKFAHLAKMRNHLLKCSKCPDIVKEDLENKHMEAPANHPHEQNKENVSPNAAPSALTDNSLTDEQKQELHAMLAKAIYVTGTPLSIVEHPLWIQVFSALQPLYKLPSRKAIATTHLENIFKNMNDEINDEIRTLNYLHLQLDGWTDVNNSGIIHFIISKPEPVFIKSVDTGENRHTAEYLKQEIIEVMSQYDERKFIVLI